MFVAHGIDVRVDADARLHADARALATRSSRTPARDGIVLTPSHNPPEDGGYKYNPPSGGPAGTDDHQGDRGGDRPNELLADVLRDRDRRGAGRRRTTTSTAYVDDLPNVIDIDAIRDAGVHIGADPLGGASVAYFQAIAERHGLNLEVVNEEVDPTFRFVPLDHDGKIRMDCSSPYVMSGLIELQGPLRRRRRLRPRRRPPRDRHAERRADEPEPLPRGRDPLPVRRRARLAGGRGHRQDARVEHDDRPRGATTLGPPAGRGPGRLQVVRRRA